MHSKSGPTFSPLSLQVQANCLAGHEPITAKGHLIWLCMSMRIGWIWSETADWYCRRSWLPWSSSPTTSSIASSSTVSKHDPWQFQQWSHWAIRSSFLDLRGESPGCFLYWIKTFSSLTVYSDEFLHFQQFFSFINGFLMLCNFLLILLFLFLLLCIMIWCDSNQNSLIEYATILEAQGQHHLPHTLVNFLSFWAESFCIHCFALCSSLWATSNNLPKTLLQLHLLCCRLNS